MAIYRLTLPELTMELAKASNHPPDPFLSVLVRIREASGNKTLTIQRTLTLFSKREKR